MPSRRRNVRLTHYTYLDRSLRLRGHRTNCPGRSARQRTGASQYWPVAEQLRASVAYRRADNNRGIYPTGPTSQDSPESRSDASSIRRNDTSAPAGLSIRQAGHSGHGKKTAKYFPRRAVFLAARPVEAGIPNSFTGLELRYFRTRLPDRGRHKKRKQISGHLKPCGTRTCGEKRTRNIKGC